MILVGICLFLVFFPVGLAVRGADLALLRDRLGLVLVVVLVQLLFGPLVAVGINTALVPTAGVMFGLVIAAMAPSAAAATLVAALTGGEVMLSRVLTLVGTLVSVVTVPAIASHIGAPLFHYVAAMVVGVLIPVALGIAVAVMRPGLADRWAGLVATGASLGNLVLVGFAIYWLVVTPAPVPWGWGIGDATWAGLALALALAVVGRVLGRLLGLAASARRAVMIALVMRNTALPLGAVLLIMDPDISVAILAYGVLGWLIALAPLALHRIGSRGA